MSKPIAILGSTGSIGVSALQVVEKLAPAFRVTALTAGTNDRLLAAQVRRFRPKVAALSDPEAARRLRHRLKDLPVRVLSGPGGVEEAAAESGAKFVLSAIVGAAGLSPTLAALRRGLDVGLANKEPLVMAGPLVTGAARRSGARLLPVDSEHSAVFQCLAGSPPAHEIHRIVLTASGGPFRGMTHRQLRRVTVKQALRHPTWRMGPKITVDSATLMNKGLEVIEAHHIFGMPFSKIEVLVHPESVVHSMVEFIDGSVLAQLGATDMQIPIQYALTYPARLNSPVSRLDLTRLEGLHFHAPDRRCFPALELAYAAGKAGGTAPAVLNAANETAVARFLEGKLPFWRIPLVLERTLRRHRPLSSPSLSAILEADRWAREFASSVV